jgi:hypothetical protein
MSKVVVGYELRVPAEAQRDEVRRHLRAQGASERNMGPGESSSGFTAFGSVAFAITALETSRSLRKELESIVGTGGLSALKVRLHEDG